jgi:hypothetical protein
MIDRRMEMSRQNVPLSSRLTFDTSKRAEDSTILRLVPGVATGFSTRAKTKKQMGARYRVAMTRVLFSTRMDSIWGGNCNLARFWGESNS